MTTRRKQREAQYYEVMNECNSTIAHLCRAYYPLDDYLYKDLYSEIGLRVWNKLHLFKHNSDIKTWVYRLSINTANKHYRRHAHKPNVISIDSLPEEALPRTDDDSEEKERQRKCLYRMIDRLNPNERAIIALYLDRKTSTEMAESLGITPSNVTTRINRIKEKLIKMHNNGEDEDPQSELFQ